MRNFFRFGNLIMGGRGRGFFLLSVCLAYFLYQIQVDAVSLSVEGLSRSEKSSIRKLRLLLKDSLPHEYMKDDLYLTKWLTMKNFNVDQTVSYLKNHIKWRQDEKIDGILNEDWSQHHIYYPYHLSTVDKEGRPILYFNYGAWDISEITQQGKLASLSRYFAKMLEHGEATVRHMRAQGKNVTQFNLLINLDGYSLAKHGCYDCLSFYGDVGRTLQRHYPGAANRIIFINAPAVFATTFGLLETVLNQETKDSIRLVGADRHLWEPVLLEYIDRGQFPADLYKK